MTMLTRHGFKVDGRFEKSGVKHTARIALSGLHLRITFVNPHLGTVDPMFNCNVHFVFLLHVNKLMFCDFRVMQEVLRERRSCRNAFEALDFMCKEYDVYVKTRLIELGTRRKLYRNSFGLSKAHVSNEVVSITRISDSSIFRVTGRVNACVTECIVDLKTGACNKCNVGYFCVHVSSAACAFPECMVKTLTS